ncbi:MAG TPA: biopolymer transporter ExbD [Bryobacteraceae bacterium]|nr:biopolymer transporter ExbD [Bryobacteraceae bacterium]
MLRRDDKQDSFLRAWPLTSPGVQLPPWRAGVSVHLKAIRVQRTPIRPEYYIGDPGTPARRPLTGLSSISLLTFLIFFVLFMLMWSCYWFPPTPVGFKVRLPQPTVTGQNSLGIQPVIVQVKFDKRSVPDEWKSPRPSLYVNWRFVPRDDFEAVLQKELNLRPPDWPVYLEGDPRMEWRHAAEVIDIVQKLHAQVVFLTSLRPPPGPAGTDPGQDR